MYGILFYHWSVCLPMWDISSRNSLQNTKFILIALTISFGCLLLWSLDSLFEYFGKVVSEFVVFSEWGLECGIQSFLFLLQLLNLFLLHLLLLSYIYNLWTEDSYCRSSSQNCFNQNETKMTKYNANLRYIDTLGFWDFTALYNAVP